MFKPRTLIVLGAGASAELGLPLGRKLKQSIKSLMSSGPTSDDRVWSVGGLRRLADQEFSEALHNAIFPQGRVVPSLPLNLYNATRIIEGGIGFSASVDNFLALRSKEPLVAQVAKAAIAWSLFEEEWLARPRLGNGSNPEQVELDGTWFQAFSEICFSGAEIDQIDEALSRFEVVSFNYDRCLEAFLRLSIMGLYSLSHDIAMKHARSVEIIYPYGSLGDYNSEAVNLELGGRNHEGRLSLAMGRIKTFAEGAADREKLAAAARKADRIVFLGYGFHRQNNDMFVLAEKSEKMVYATCHGFSE